VGPRKPGDDPKDAQVIPHMLRIGAVQVFHDPLVAGTCDIQELSKTYEMVARAKTELWHRILTHYPPLYFPEADRFHRSSRGDWFLAFLEAFPSPHMITAMDKDAFVAAAWPVIGRRVSKAALLANIYETSKTSVGLPVAPDSDAIRMFRLVLAHGRSLIQQRNAIEERAAELLGDHPDYHLPRSIPGIGPLNALAVLAEAGDLRRFRHHRQFLKFRGMDLATVQSGQFRGRSKISKYGNARLRRTLWIAAQAAVLKPANSFRDKFERYIAQDRHNPDLRRKAYTAIAEHTELPPRGELVVHEVHRPGFGRRGGILAILSKLGLHPPLRRLVSQLRARLPVDAMGFLVIDLPALAPQPRMDTAHAIANAGRADLLDAGLRRACPGRRERY
jgi:hypothetical protein